MENSKRAVTARVEKAGVDPGKFLEEFPRFDGEPSPRYWARLHHVIDNSETIVERTLTKRDTPDFSVDYRDHKYVPTKAHLNFAVEPVPTKASHIPMVKSGFCQFPGRLGYGHKLCWGDARPPYTTNGCECTCHEEA